MRPVTALFLSAQLLLGVNSQDFTVDTDCKDLKAGALSGSLPQPVHWAKASDLSKADYCSHGTKECCDKRMERNLPLPLRYPEAAAYYKKCANVVIPKPSSECDIVLPVSSCDKVADFSCGMNNDPEFCNIKFAERDHGEPFRRFFDRCMGKDL
ncbi:Uncharacterized protein TPAR_03701 [Tolypocladium paradoxum]|uniref:Uncharacterized protein n=1 Tax=Tolypocladium paradoxum TaxID=94208 RepID=A0A2S4L0X0_9HYPO|nr:Uncharacterized protein TPAR_03701 [Tolypocladium paradoxum]